jgi:biopolymer transport protein ExbB
MGVTAWLFAVAPALAQQAADSAEAAPEEEAVPDVAPAKLDLPPGPSKPAVQPPTPKSLRELLQMVRDGFDQERDENRRREAAFLAAQEDQARLLAEAEVELGREESFSERLEEAYNQNEGTIGSQQERLTGRLGEMGELFGVVRLVSNDLAGNVWESLTSAQLRGRNELLDRLGRSTELPSTQDLENLWYQLQRELIAQGEVVRFRTRVLTLAGDEQEMDVIRVGPFSALAGGRYLHWEAEKQLLRELTRQPPTKYSNTVAPFESAQAGFATLAVDPSRGSLLNALTDTPNFTERIGQGGAVGAVIIVLGLFAVVLGVFRWIVITIVGRQVSAQRKRERADSGNPLGRVLSVYEENQNYDTETLELKLDEVVLRETGKLERFLWLVKVVSVVAPLLGLLGTVTGMIQTFQAITLFGAGDPKMMAGGISEALVTTMLGLTTAIPLVLLHSTLANSTRRIISILDEQSAGLIAKTAERANA